MIWVLIVTFHRFICFHINIKNIDKHVQVQLVKMYPKTNRPQPFSQWQKHEEKQSHAATWQWDRHRWQGGKQNEKTSKQTHSSVSPHQQLFSARSANRQPNVDQNLPKWRRDRLMQMPHDRWEKYETADRRTVSERGRRGKREAVFLPAVMEKA